MPLITPSGGGGGAPSFRGAVVSFDNAMTGFNNGDTLKPDHIWDDTGSFYTQATGVFAAATAGKYLLTGYGEALSESATALTSWQLLVVVTGAFDNVTFSGSTAGPSGLIWDAAGAAILHLSAGNSVKVQGRFTGPATVSIQPGTTGLAFEALG
jgi:hypothetical protein